MLDVIGWIATAVFPCRTFQASGGSPPRTGRRGVPMDCVRVVHSCVARGHREPGRCRRRGLVDIEDGRCAAGGHTT